MVLPLPLHAEQQPVQPDFPLFLTIVITSFGDIGIRKRIVSDDAKITEEVLPGGGPGTQTRQ